MGSRKIWRSQWNRTENLAACYVNIDRGCLQCREAQPVIYQQIKIFFSTYVNCRVAPVRFLQKWKEVMTQTTWQHIVLRYSELQKSSKMLFFCDASIHSLLLFRFLFLKSILLKILRNKNWAKCIFPLTSKFYRFIFSTRMAKYWKRLWCWKVMYASVVSYW